jgi:hypothetical protein
VGSTSTAGTLYGAYQNEDIIHAGVRFAAAGDFFGFDQPSFC